MSPVDLSLCLRPPSASAEELSTISNPAPPTDLKRDLLFLILQFLNEEKYPETVHKLEKESNVFFNLKYLEESILSGLWEQADDYISGFIKMTDSANSTAVFFHLYWNKYLEAIVSGNKLKAVDMLTNKMKPFQAHPQLLKELVQHLSLPSKDSRPSEVETFIKSLRIKALNNMKNAVCSHPQLRDKLQFPTICGKRLKTLLSQSMHGQR